METLKKTLARKTLKKSKQTGIQTILIAYEKNQKHTLAGGIRESLIKQHGKHQVTLISDYKMDKTELKGVKRWCIEDREVTEEDISVCLNTVKPTHILAIGKAGITKDEGKWIKLLEIEAMRRGILFTRK